MQKRPRKPKREDVNETASRVAREATRERPEPPPEPRPPKRSKRASESHWPVLFSSLTVPNTWPRTPPASLPSPAREWPGRAHSLPHSLPVPRPVRYRGGADRGKALAVCSLRGRDEEGLVARHPADNAWNRDVSGAINHALRFTVPRVRRAYAAPASHCGAHSDPELPPYGLRVRLRADFPLDATAATRS